MGEQRFMKGRHQRRALAAGCNIASPKVADHGNAGQLGEQGGVANLDRKSTRLNSSHVKISYAVLCLKKKNNKLVVMKNAQSMEKVTTTELKNHTTHN